MQREDAQGMRTLSCVATQGTQELPGAGETSSAKTGRVKCLKTCRCTVEEILRACVSEWEAQGTARRTLFCRVQLSSPLVCSR